MTTRNQKRKNEFEESQAKKSKIDDSREEGRFSTPERLEGYENLVKIAVDQIIDNFINNKISRYPKKIFFNQENVSDNEFISLIEIKVTKDKKKVLMIKDVIDAEGFSLIKRALYNKKLASFLEKNEITGLDIQSENDRDYKYAAYRFTDQDSVIIQENFGFIKELFIGYSEATALKSLGNSNIEELSFVTPQYKYPQCEPNLESNIRKLVLYNGKFAQYFVEANGKNLEELHVVNCTNINDIGKILVNTPKLKFLTLKPTEDFHKFFFGPSRFSDGSDVITHYTPIQDGGKKTSDDINSFRSIPLTWEVINKEDQKKVLNSKKHLIIPKSLVYLKLDNFFIHFLDLKRLLFFLTQIEGSKLKFLDLSTTTIIDDDDLIKMLTINTINFKILFNIEDFKIMSPKVSTLINIQNHSQLSQLSKQIQSKSYKLIKDKFVTLILCLIKKHIGTTLLTNEMIFELLLSDEDFFIESHDFYKSYCLTRL